VDGSNATGIYDLNDGLFYRVTCEAGVFLRAPNGTLEFSDLHVEEQAFVKEVVRKNIVSYASVKGIKQQTSLQEVLCIKQSLEFAWIKLTSKCNQLCLHCFVGDQLNQFAHVPKEKVIEYTDALIAYGARKIIIRVFVVFLWNIRCANPH